jgi:hypothetical protein
LPMYQVCGSTAVGDYADQSRRGLLVQRDRPDLRTVPVWRPTHKQWVRYGAGICPALGWSSIANRHRRAGLPTATCTVN